ncbi:MAG: hypothetical protein ACJ8AS_03190 [Hyphomicrobiales bacterium]
MASAMLVEIIAGLLLGIIPIGIAWRSRDSAAIVASLILMVVAGGIFWRSGTPNRWPSQRRYGAARAPFQR